MSSTLQRTALCPLVPTLTKSPTVKFFNNTYSFCSQVITFGVKTSVCGCDSPGEGKKMRNVCVCVGVIVGHLCDLFRLFPLLHYVQFGSAVSLIISDVDGDLSGLQPLKAVTLTATPLIDVLQEREREEMGIKVRIIKISVLVDLVKTVNTGGNSKFGLILQVSEFQGKLTQLFCQTNNRRATCVSVYSAAKHT